MANKFHTDRILENIKTLKETLPTVLANQAQNFFVKSWRNQGWEGKPWPTPQRKIEGTFAYKFASPAARSRATMVKSGALRRATGMSIRSRTFERINLVVGLPYARIHNDGGTINIPEHSAVVHFKSNSQNVQTKKLKGTFSKKGKADYAQKVTIPEHTVKIPARTYMKDSKTLREEQKKKINQYVDRVWKA